MFQKLFIKLICFAFICIYFSGCVYCGYSIEKKTEVLENPCSVKFYIDSISGTFIQEHETDIIKRDLLAKYPDFFVSDKTKGANISFTWNINFNFKGGDTAFISGFTFGIIPCLIWNTHSGIIVAKNSKVSHLSSMYDDTGIKFRVKSTKILHMPLLSVLTDPIAAIFVSAGSDLTSDYCASVRDTLYIPFKSCDANLRLFPLACIKYYDRLSEREKKRLDNKYNPKDIVLIR